MSAEHARIEEAMLEQKHGETVQPVCSMLNNVMHVSCFYVEGLDCVPETLGCLSRKATQAKHLRLDALFMYFRWKPRSDVQSALQQIIGFSPCESLRVNPVFFDDESCVRES